MNSYMLAMQPGNALDYIRQPTAWQRGKPVFIVCRESPSHARTPAAVADLLRKLDDAEAALRKAAAAHGWPILGVVKEEWKATDALWLSDVAAQALAAGAALFAETTCRYVRNGDYWAGDQNWLPTKMEYERLRRATWGCPLVTLVDPAASNSAMRSYLSKRGQAATGNRGGRPPDKAAMARMLYEPNTPGRGIGPTARALGVSESTLRHWLKRSPDPGRGASGG